MVSMENSKYEELCRLCATKTTMVLAIHIFENEGTIRQISKKIDTCLPIKVQETDQLPKMICENCLYKLELFSDFRERTARTERLLVELYKELASNRTHNQDTCLVPVPIDSSDLILVQQHQLLNDQALHNVSEIDLTNLGHREGIIVDHEIILAHQNVAHSLDSIDLNNQDLSQEHSNQSLRAHEGAIVDVNSGIQDSRYTENLNLMQHQLLTDQFRLQQELQLNMPEGSTNLALEDQNNVKTDSNRDNEYHSSEKINKCSSICDINSINYPDSKLISNDITLETKLDEIHPQENYHGKKIRFRLESFKQEDSNSGHSLQIDEQMHVPDQQIYDINLETSSIMDDNNQIKNWLYCNLCNKSYEEKTDFEMHYEKHFYKCEICLALFTNIDVFNLHRKEIHGSSIAEQNSESTKKNPDLDRLNSEYGLKLESEESDLDCDIGQMDDDANGVNPNNSKRKKWCPKICKECGKSYQTNYKLSEHMRKHTGEKPYKCKTCDKAFRSKIGLAQHEAKHTGQYDYACPTCGKGFQCKSYLMVHQRVHSNIKPYPCATCGQNFKTKQSLLDHTNRHLGVKPYVCDICGRSFITKGLCRAHQKVHSGLDNRKYSCKICSKMFVSKSYLQTHLRIHTGEKPFMCEVCGKGFLTRVDLKIHSTMHTGEKSYVCEMCGKAFARRDALRCHRRSHTGERPYSCEICGQTFTQFTPMAIHKRLHTGERPYTCETCGKAFVSRSTMMYHAKKHDR